MSQKKNKTKTRINGFKTKGFSHTSLVVHLNNGDRQIYYSLDQSAKNQEKGILRLEQRILYPILEQIDWGYIQTNSNKVILHYYHSSKGKERLSRETYQQCLVKHDTRYNCTLYANNYTRETYGDKKPKAYFSLTEQEIKALFERYKKYLACIKIWSRYEKGLQLGYINAKGTLVWFDV